jgi:hypothetical protein
MAKTPQTGGSFHLGAKALESSDRDTTRLLELEARTYHIDGKVAAIESQLDSQGAQLSRIEQHLLHKPPTNYAAWVGVVLTLLLMVGGLFAGAAKFTASQMDYIRDDIAKNAADLADVKGYQSIDGRKQLDRAFELGRQTAEIIGMIGRLDHYDELYHDLDRRVRAEEQKSAESRTSRKAIGDYAKELGRKSDTGPRDR